MSTPKQPTAVEIRPLQPADRAAVLALIREVFRPASIDALISDRFGGPDWFAVKGAAAGRVLDANPAGCFVAILGGRLVGMVSTEVSAEASRGRIADLAVAADCQGHSIGRRLLGRALDHFRSLGLRHAKIETLATNAAGQHLYPQLGFVEVARQVHYAMSLR